MLSPKDLLIFVILVQVVLAFNLSDHLFSSELNSSLSYTNFTYNGTQHSIIKINQQQIFLLKNDEPILIPLEIENAIHDYSIRTFYPSPSEINELLAAIDQFNKSRNDGDPDDPILKGKEEYLCRDEVILSNGKIIILGKPVRCIDEASCSRLAELLFSAFGKKLGWGSPAVIYGPLLNFTPSSLAMDDLLANYSSRVSNMNENSVSDTLSYITSTVDNLYTYSSKIESTIFRRPKQNDNADRAACLGKCYSLCPPLDLDQSAITRIKTVASNLSTKVQPLKDYRLVSSTIYNNSISRIAYRSNETAAKYFTQIFASINGSGKDSIALGQTALISVSDPKLSSDLTRLKFLHQDIPFRIQSRNFTNMDRSVTDYQSLLSSVRNSSITLLTLYNDTAAELNRVNYVLLSLDSKDLDPFSASSFQTFRNQTLWLDSEFRDGLTSSQLISLKSNFSQLYNESEPLLFVENEAPSSKSIIVFRSFAKNLNLAIAKFISSTKIIAPSDIQNNFSISFGLFSLIIFLSFGSLLLFVFLSSNASLQTGQHHQSAKKVILIFYAFGIVILTVFSILLYVFLNKTSADATLSEYVADLYRFNSTSVIVDLRNVSALDSQHILSCGSRLRVQLSTINKKSLLYQINQDGCTVLSSSSNYSLGLTACENVLVNESSTIYLHHFSSYEKPQFSTVYQNRADFYADPSYYRSCPILSIFSNVSINFPTALLSLPSSQPVSSAALNKTYIGRNISFSYLTSLTESTTSNPLLLTFKDDSSSASLLFLFINTNNLTSNLSSSESAEIPAAILLNHSLSTDPIGAMTQASVKGNISKFPLSQGIFVAELSFNSTENNRSTYGFALQLYDTISSSHYAVRIMSNDPSATASMRQLFISSFKRS